MKLLRMQRRKRTKRLKKTVDEEYEKAADKYDLDNPDYEAVPIKIYENFYKDSGEDRDLDGEKDGNIRVFIRIEQM